MAVDAVNASTGTNAATSSIASSAVDKNEFLRLLVTQIQNQDPFSPMDNQQFISQLTQFTSLEQLQTINGQLEQGLVVSQSLNNTMLLGLVGRQATVEGDTTAVVGGTATRTQLTTDTGGTATVEIKNAAGQVVASYQRQVKAGWNDVTWDGRLADGTTAADGSYTVSVKVTDRAGTAVASKLYESGPVDSIRFENNIAIVKILGRDHYVSEIAQISR